jgi:hypothetical protein
MIRNYLRRSCTCSHGSLNPAFLYFSLPVAAQAFQAVDTHFGPLGIGRLKMPRKRDGTVRKFGADEPKTR